MTFTDPEAYERFMGRYSAQLAPVFARFAGIVPTMTVVDVGCGPGALAVELNAIVGATRLAAADPSPAFVQTCRQRVPGADVRRAPAEELPWRDGTFDAALAQLVLHLMTRPEAGVEEMVRVVRPGGVVAACTWDLRGSMEMLSTFWDAAVALDPAAPAEGSRTRAGTPEELRALWIDAGLVDVTSGTLTVEVTYDDFDDFWLPFTLGVGPAGSYCKSLGPPQREALRAECFRRLGEPRDQFTLSARAWAVEGLKPVQKISPDGPVS